jgi:maleate isomerase
LSDGARPIRLGVLTPSSNTALEPLTARMLDGLPEVSAHFARFTVTQIALAPDALAQFDDEPILAAAAQLADAHVDAIVWSGTSAGWLGMAADETLCRRIAERTGIPATTSVLDLQRALQLVDCRTIGLVTPYTDDVQARIVETYAAAGVRVASERHLGIRVNYDFAGVPPATLAEMARAVAAELRAGAQGPAAIVTFCTNLHAAPLASALEAETGLPVFDTVATGVWGGLRLAGADASRVRGWGSLFALPPE